MVWPSSRRVHGVRIAQMLDIYGIEEPCASKRCDRVILLV